MEWVETTGSTVEEAKDAALDQLGVDEQDAEFEVLEEPRTGLFGRTRGEARVRARVRPTQPRPKVERRDRRGRSGRPGKPGDRKRQGGGDRRPGGAGKPRSAAATTEPTSPAAGDVEDTTAEPAPKPERSDGAARSGAPRRRRGGRGRGSQERRTHEHD